MSRHLHFYFSTWTNESRAWRAGTLARERGYVTDVDYIGHKGDGLLNVEQIADGQRIVRLSAEPAPPGSSRLLRALSLPRWWWACLREVNIDDTSLIIAHSLAALPIAVRMARKYKLPLLYDAHELETERAGWSKPIRKIAKTIESHLIRKCDHVILVNDSIRDWYQNSYPGLDASVVRNVPVIPNQIGKSTLRKILGLSDEAIIFVYCGALGRDRGLSELIEAFRYLDTTRHLILIGYGHESEALTEQAKGMANIHFHHAVPQSELITLLSGADVGVVVLNTLAKSYEYALPNKLFEYAAAGLGIIIGNGPELQRFSKEYPATRSADLTVESLRQAVTCWTREELRELAPAISAYSPPSWQKEQELLLYAFDRAIESGRRRWS